MNTQSLINLIEISKYTSMSEASKYLHLTPQALSISIKTLENELGFKLLDTTFTGSTLTVHAQALVAIAQKFLADVDALKASAAASEQNSREILLLASTPGIIDSYLDKLYEYVKVQNQNYIIDFRSYAISELIHKVQTQEIPYAFAYNSMIDNIPFINDSALVCQSIKQHRVFILAHIDHPLAKYKSVSLRSAFRYPMISMENTADMFERAFALYGRPPKIHYVPSQAVLKTALENNVGFLLTYETNDHLTSTNIVKVKLTSSFLSSFDLIYHHRFPFNASIKSQIQFLTNFFDRYFSQKSTNC